MKCNACCRRGSRPVIGPCSMVTLFYYDTVTVTWFVSLSTQSNKIIKCNKLAYRRDSARRRSLRHSRSSSSSSSSSLKFLEWPKQQRHATTRTTIDRVSTSSIRQCCNSSGISVYKYNSVANVWNALKPVPLILECCSRRLNSFKDC